MHRDPCTPGLSSEQRCVTLGMRRTSANVAVLAPPAGLCDGHELGHERLEALQWPLYRAVADGLLRAVVRLQEEAVDPGGRGGARNGRHQPAQATGLWASAPGGRALHRVRGVHHHEGPGRRGAHARQVAHVHHEVAITEGRASLREQHAAMGAARGLRGGGHLARRVAHDGRRGELALLHVHHLARFARGGQQVRLPAEEGRDLHHVDRVRNCGHLPRLVDVRGHREARGVAHAAQGFQGSVEAQAPRAPGGGAVGLVKGALVDSRDAQAARDLRDGVRHAQRVVGGLQRAGSGDEEEGRRALEPGEEHALLTARPQQGGSGACAT
mmetsp:Transcript_14888/g.50192  ORF Transcript_14888/g.50192 Transcript_14888/m.50192 type:complete len:327 (-) Transcript_14888:38-1018(-)